MAALYRQSGTGGNRNGNVAPDYVSVGIHGGTRHLHHRRLKPPPAYRISIGLFALTISLVLSISALFYHILQSNAVEISIHQAQDDDISTDADFLKNVTRTEASKYHKLGNGSFSRGRDSRDRGKDAKMRDENEALRQTRDGSVENIRSIMKNIKRKSLFNGSHRGLYKEGEHNELIMFEAKYKASLKNVKGSKDVVGDDQLSDEKPLVGADEYDDGLDLRADVVEELGDAGHDGTDRATSTILPHSIDTWDSSHLDLVEDEKQDVVEEADKDSSDLNSEETLPHPQNASDQFNSKRTRPAEGQPVRRLIPEKRRSDSKKKPKNRKPPSACQMEIMNSTALLVEPPESKKFGRFSLQYTEREEKPISKENWEPRYAGHQTLREREESFIARDQEIKCGFVNGPNGSSITGFNLDEDDAKYINSCSIAVSSCIFGNSDRLRSPMGKTVSRLSKKNVCFVMFVDEVTLNTLSSEGHTPDTTGFIGLWKIVVVKDLPYSDMRRVGKIPKLLPHRLFPSARYSIWLDSKLRLQLDPLLILEYFLWRKGYEYAISNHYDRHCLWEEVAQNKKLNKYNHSVIDEQFVFYQSDGMRRFNESDPDKLLPSNVPEGSFIVRAHTPMSNLFSCLWFNEVDRFTPRDQLSFAYTYHKLRRMNPGKPFYLNMFKDCERRKIAKLYRHRSEEKRASSSHVDL
ncbi:probable hexosyltransferase MUCI70 isoform X1 [Salvia splendens]|uniref:probable hexosyltransferase MUCI70 isoform X1 n=1 Tax=Salvia splendens TaxID=180675 RepID=UPI001C275D3E|nr:probable hexosyltransferase MUCI70 isoform X1 [Salvia splendens]